MDLGEIMKEKIPTLKQEEIDVAYKDFIAQIKLNEEKLKEENLDNRQKLEEYLEFAIKNKVKTRGGKNGSRK